MDAQVDLGQRAFGLMSPRQRESWTYVASLRVRQGTFLGAFIAGRPVGAARLARHASSGGTAVPCRWPGWPA